VHSLIPFLSLYTHIDEKTSIISSITTWVRVEAAIKGLDQVLKYDRDVGVMLRY